MEEVDRIIIHSLKDIGCGIPESTESLDGFTTELVIEAASKCLKRISPGTDLPESLPVNMAARFHVGASIALACKDFGYTGEVGYQTFLYSNVTEVRKVFIFLIEKLPRESEKTTEYYSCSKFKSDIAEAVKASLNTRAVLSDTPNFHFISDYLETGISVDETRNLSPQEWRNYCVNELKFIHEQTVPERVLPSVIKLNSQGLIKAKPRVGTPTNVPLSPTPVPLPRDPKKPKPMTWLSLQEAILHQTAPVPARRRVHTSDKEVTREQEVAEEDGQGPSEEEIIRQRVERLQTILNADVAVLSQLKKECEQNEVQLQSQVKELQVFHKALELLSEPEINCKKLEDSIAVAQQRLLALGSQWELHRKPAIEKCKATKLKNESKCNDNENKKEQLNDLKAKLDTMTKKIASKQSLKDRLQEEYNQLPKNISRTSYTVRIIEIISNIKKQKDEIDKILKDTKELQRNTNQLMGCLDRSFRVVDETIFRNAKKDEHSKKAYKHLATLHTDCMDIIKMVLETGAIIREIRDLEEQTEVESSKNVGANLERISSDLSLMKSENASLTKQLKHS